LQLRWYDDTQHELSIGEQTRNNKVSHALGANYQSFWGRYQRIQAYLDGLDRYYVVWSGAKYNYKGCLTDTRNKPIVMEKFLLIYST